MSRTTLEDRVFGPDSGSEERSGAAAVPLSAADRIAAYMLPFMLSLFMTLVVLYSLCKSIEYQDLFQNPRYRTYLLSVNGAVILGTTAVIVYAVQCEASKPVG